MPTIRLETFVQAPIDRVFDLARSIDLHAETMKASSERAVDGVTTGLIEAGQTVTLEAAHFGFRQQLTAKIVVCDRPHHFQDVMVRGAFAEFTHDHRFSAIENGTIMSDVFDYRSPLGPLGNLADILFLKRYMTKLLAERNRMLKEAAEGNSWQKFLPTFLP